MDNSVDQQRLDEYEKRVAAWMAKQGILFQLRHAGTLGGNSLLKQVGALFVRFVMVAIILLGVAFFALYQHFASESFREKISSEVGAVLGAESATAKKFERARGLSIFQDMEITGGEESFFYEATIEKLTVDSSFLSGFLSDWMPEQIRMKSAHFEIKAGGEQLEMDKAFSGIIESFDGGNLDSIEIEDLSCEWGLSKLTHGRLEGVKFLARREAGVWEITLEGGRSSQNWLKDLVIEEAEMTCAKDGIKVKKMILLKEDGRLELAGSVLGPSSRPEFNLEGTFESLSILSVLSMPGVVIRDYVSGLISGDLRISGSTDQCIEIEGDVKLGDDDVITLREKWNLLKAMAVLDVDRSYRRVDFKEGGFSFKTEGGGLVLKEIDLSAGSQVRLQGNLKTHLPTQQEAADSLGITLTEGVGASFESDSDITDTSAAKYLENEPFRLEGAVDEDQEDEISLEWDESGALEFSDFQRGTLSQEAMDEARLRFEMTIHRVTGELRMGVSAAALSGNENLKTLYPADADDWCWFVFEVKSNFSNISAKMAKRVLDEAIRRKEFVEED